MGSFILFKTILIFVATVIAIWYTCKPEALKQFRISLLIVICGLSFWVFTNFWNFHGSTAIHRHDFFHYYVGSKYHTELGYDRIYQCTAAAIAELRPEAPKQIFIKDLRRYRNIKITAKDSIESCQSYFSDYQWSRFKNDIETFIQILSGKGILRALVDHGFNATPLWIHLWSYVSQNIEVTTLYQVLPLIDTCFVVMSYFLVLSLVGIELSLFWLLIVFLMPFASYQWIGGSFARWDWFFFSHLTFYFFYKSQRKLAIGALVIACLLRVFPVLFLVGIFKRTTILTDILTALLFAGVMFFVTGGVSEWGAFYNHLQSFSRSSPSNFIGFSIIERLFGKTQSIPFTVFTIRAILYSWLAFYTIVCLRDWKQGLPVIPMGLVFILPLSNYYFTFIALLIFIVQTKPKALILIFTTLTAAWFAEDPFHVTYNTSLFWSILLMSSLTCLAMMPVEKTISNDETLLK